MCEYRTRTGNKCRRDGRHEYNKKIYCLRHYKQLTNKEAMREVKETKNKEKHCRVSLKGRLSEASPNAQQKKKPVPQEETDDELIEIDPPPQTDPAQVKPKSAKRKVQSKVELQEEPKSKSKPKEEIEVISESEESPEESPKQKQFNSLLNSIRQYRNPNEIARNMVQETIYGPKTKGRIFG